MKITRQLPVSKEQLLELFPKCDAEIFFRDPKSDHEFMTRFLPNKLWRLNNLHTIVNKDGEKIPFVMNKPQLRVYAASLIHPRLIILKSRQQGISTFWLISYHDDAIFRDHLSIGLMAQGRDEAGTLLTRTKLDWDNFNEDIKKRFNLTIEKDNADEIGFNNGSTVFIRTSFRSATLQRLHISEYGKICNRSPSKAKEVKTGTLQAIKPGNNVVIESTAEGINDFKYMWDKDYGKDPLTLGPKEFYCVFLSWVYDDDCRSDVYRKPTKEQEIYFAEIEKELNIELSEAQKNFWIDQYGELGEAIYQEYPSTPEEAFRAVRDGTYYATMYNTLVINKQRRIKGLYDKNLPVHLAMDIGMNDLFVLGFFQVWRGEVRLIHEYVCNGKGLKHYVNYIYNTGYNVEDMYCPHDIAVRELNDGKDRESKMQELNQELIDESGKGAFENLIVLPKIPVSDGVEMVRAMLNNFYIDESCSYIHDCFLNFSKQWDERLEVWKDQPRKDDYIHGMDMIRYLAFADTMSNKAKTHTKETIRKSIHDRQVVDGLCI